jgi:hypothetical protein
LEAGPAPASAIFGAAHGAALNRREAARSQVNRDAALAFKASGRISTSSY